MLNLIRFCLILFNIDSVILNLNISDVGVCENGTTGKPVCCYEYRLHNGRCISCPIGFIMAVDYCVTCNNNWYGDKCLRECNCLVGQRCDNVLGCINETTETAYYASTTWSTEYVTQIRIHSIETEDELEITIPTPTKNINDGLLNKDIFLYSVVVACILVILGLSYLVVKYRQKTKIKIDISNAMQNIHSNRRHSLINSNFSIYDEIDENLIVENLNINMVHINESIIDGVIQQNTDNTSYLNPVYSADNDSITPPVSVNNSYLSIQESDKSSHPDESNGDDDTISYLHPYHTVDEDWKDKTHQYDVTHVLEKESDDSSDSNTQMTSDGYLHPYQPLKEGWKQLSHSYESPVTVHQCQKSLTIPVPSSIEPKVMKNIGKDESQPLKDSHNFYPSLSFDKDKTKMSENGHQKLLMENSSDKIKQTQPLHSDNIMDTVTSSKQEITGVYDCTDTIMISSNKEMKDISKRTDNILEIPTKFKNIRTTLEKTETSTPVSNQNDLHKNVHEYTDAKSQ